MRPSELLRKRGWTQGAFAKGKYGYPRLWTDPFANSYCVVGAIKHVYHKDAARTEAVISALRKHIGLTGTQSLVEWNDAEGRTVEQVITALEAIEE